MTFQVLMDSLKKSVVDCANAVLFLFKSLLLRFFLIVLDLAAVSSASKVWTFTTALLRGWGIQQRYS